MDAEEKKLDAVAPVAGERSGSWAGLLVGLLLFAFCTFVMGTGIDGFPNFVDIPSLAIILGTVFGGWMIAYGAFRPFRLLLLAITGRVADVKEGQNVVAFCSCGIWLLLLGGVTGTISGLVTMLVMGFFSGKADLLSAGLSVCILTFFWSWVLSVLLVALRYRAVELCSAMTARSQKQV